MAFLSPRAAGGAARAERPARLSRPNSVTKSSRLPPWAANIRRTRRRPSPVPSALVLIRSRESLGTNAGSMPRLESMTLTMTFLPSATMPVCIETADPFPPAASMELAKRFQKACSRRPPIPGDLLRGTRKARSRRPSALPRGASLGGGRGDRSRPSNRRRRGPMGRGRGKRSIEGAEPVGLDPHDSPDTLAPGSRAPGFSRARAWRGEAPSSRAMLPFFAARRTAAKGSELVGEEGGYLPPSFEPSRLGSLLSCSAVRSRSSLSARATASRSGSEIAGSGPALSPWATSPRAIMAPAASSSRLFVIRRERGRRRGAAAARTAASIAAISSRGGSRRLFP